MGAHGFYATPGVDYNRETGRGNPFLYYTQGAAVAEVEIDRFTGELKVPRVDLLIDIGRWLLLAYGVLVGTIVASGLHYVWVWSAKAAHRERGKSPFGWRSARARFGSPASS